MVLMKRDTVLQNQFFSRLIKHPKSTNFDEGQDGGDVEERPAKRHRSHDDNNDESDAGYASPTLRTPPQRRPNTDVESDESDSPDDSEVQRPTDLESALPPIKTDKEAIAEYEASRAAEEAEKARIEGRLDSGKWVRGRSSIYVDAFNLALETVLEEESHLFNGTELALFEHWRKLGYEAQYLYVRLFLRKTSAWHRIHSLRYHSDLADIQAAVRTLQSSRKLPEPLADTHDHPGELEPPEGTTLGTSFTFADDSDEHITTLDEASTLLRLDELKVLAKDAKVQGKNKQDLIKNLRRSSSKQTGIGWTDLKRSDSEISIRSVGTERSEDERSTRANGSSENLDAHFVDKILSETGPCIRLSLAPLKLFERVHLVFYRSTEWTEKSLITIILARIARRNFPEYIVSRSANIFPSRGILLEFEASLRTQFRVDDILEFHGTPSRGDLDTILQIFEDVYPRWRALLREEQRKEDSIYVSGEGAYLRRLSPAWVYTRIVHKAAAVSGKQKKHKREHELLTELLVQRLFHTSRRGAWYQRKALLEEHYMSALTPSESRGAEAQQKLWKRVALATCEEGLQDPLVHLIHHYDLQKRVTKLERALKIAKREQHDFAHVRLAKPVEVTVEGVRLENEADRTPPPPPRPASRTISNESKPPALLRHRSSGGGGSTSRRGTRTVWEDPLEEGGPCSVEAMCLSHYRTRGWKGYHSEGGVVRTLFALLFYDVLFAYVPHVFQTAFQTCPLDLHAAGDAFFPARLSEINRRLADIANGAAEGLVREVWDAHSERRTCVVGLDWSFELGDLLEIVRCFDPEALATVCKVMAQEYAQRGGGVPDLFLWHPERGEVMFAEVKSENDRLSDTQRMWIHVLSSAGVRVELCHAVAKEVKLVP